MSVTLRCPECHSPIQRGDNPSCSGGHTFTTSGGIIDFVGALPYDRDCAIDHCGEADGLRSRVVNYFVPWVRKIAPLNAVQVLDDGCGNGEVIKRMVELGVDAYGIDPGHRSTKWTEHNIPDRLFVADGTKLPFADKTFDAVISCGVIEHVGEGVATTRRGQDPYKERYIHEVARVLKPGGRALIAAPNGAFPLDFWHALRYGVRVHRPYEIWMPNSFTMRRWVRNSPVPVTLRFLPPGDFLAFERVRQYWYGRAFGGAMRGVLSTIDRFPALSASVVNPLLIAELSRP